MHKYFGNLSPAKKKTEEYGTNNRYIGFTKSGEDEYISQLFCNAKNREAYK